MALANGISLCIDCFSLVHDNDDSVYCRWKCSQMEENLHHPFVGTPPDEVTQMIHVPHKISSLCTIIMLC